MLLPFLWRNRSTCKIRIAFYSLVGTMVFIAVVNPLIVFLASHQTLIPLVFKCLSLIMVSPSFTRSSAANIPVNLEALSKALWSRCEHISDFNSRSNHKLVQLLPSPSHVINRLAILWV